ncbi:MAG: peptidylprolyl isomerase [Burkholderiales bacterium]
MNLLKLWKPLVILSAAAASPAAAAAPQVDVKTNLGTIRLELYPSKAPRTVANFLQYVREGHYNNTIFHRVIDGFMIQGGGFDRSYDQKPTHPPIPNEAQAGVKAWLKNDIGAIAMARTSNPDSATAQFFINLADNAFLNWGDPRGDGNGYAVFGKVVSGFNVVTRIAKTPTGRGGPFAGDVPREPIVIESMTLVDGN